MRLVRVAVGAGHDEGRGQGVDLVEGERAIEGLRDGGLPLGRAQDGVVAGLDGQDGSGGGEEGRVGDEGRGSEVGADADALEDTGEANEGCWVGGGEGVGACGDGVVAERTAEVADVGGLVLGDLSQVGVEWVGEPGVDKVGLGVVHESLAVEDILEMLKGESIVEDLNYSGVSDAILVILRW